ncbi:lysine-specific histone demethylase-like protein, putative [Medicago truncatula]|uniref:Lysine-specific histone demethylase-like protein, putative n=1 Tax=Medicago truncatula TaxID=3880 RepID=G7IR87_MEDTR|nr:lysine-specific histone demethylase-like protein, putative [Medicago truncatula]
MRNHILAPWRGSVRVWVTKGQIRESFCNEYEHFLTSLPKAMEGIVVVIGVGLDGLAAARYHPGRGVYIEKIGNEGKFAVADLGGRVITGIHANL